MIYLGSWELVSASLIGWQPVRRINFPRLDLFVHTALVLDPDKKAGPGTEHLCELTVFGRCYGWSLLSQNTDITLIFRGRVAIYSHIYLAVLKMAKIRGTVPVAGQAKAGVCYFDFRFCRVTPMKYFSLELLTDAHKEDHNTHWERANSTFFFSLSRSQYIFLHTVRKVTCSS